ncbi:MAG: response regulator [Candidatus Hydrogenedentes bacterium]|nr:response regulator [Candidatus Hydrogenedentota bacterium]
MCVKPSILIVDDEANIRSALERWFNIRGFQVEQAQDGQEAVEKCATRQYDVITMDLEMPRMNGIDAIFHIKQSQPNVPIVVLTAYPRDSKQALENGASMVLTKPLRLRDLEAQVRELLGS